jgi:hypothetical protein
MQFTTHPRFAKIAAVLLAVAIVSSACSDDLDSTTVAAVAADDTDMPMDDTAMDDTAMDKEEHGHSHDDAADAVPWDGGAIPTVEVVVTGDSTIGWDIEASVSGFSFSNPSSTDHVAGWGHTHVFLDGQLLGMKYEPLTHVDGLDPGPHQATVTLSRNDHTNYSLDDELITATTSFIVEGDITAADARFEVVYADGSVSGVDGREEVSIGDLVELVVQSDSADSVHVHGYDLLLDLEAGSSETLRFEADIPGIFEIELEGTRVLLFNLLVG